MMKKKKKKYSVSDSFELPEDLDRRFDSKKYSYFRNTYENIDMSKILTAVQKLEEELDITFSDDSFDGSIFSHFI